MSVRVFRLKVAWLLGLLLGAEPLPVAVGFSTYAFLFIGRWPVDLAPTPTNKQKQQRTNKHNNTTKKNNNNNNEDTHVPPTTHGQHRAQ